MNTFSQQKYNSSCIKDIMFCVERTLVVPIKVQQHLGFHLNINILFLLNKMLLVTQNFILVLKFFIQNNRINLSIG